MGFHTLATDGSEKTTPSSSSVTITTTGNIDDLDFLNADLIRMNNASLATIRGLKAGVDGQRVTIMSIGAGEVDLAHQNTGSVAGNRLINFATSGITPLAAGVGTADYQYDATTARWRLDNHNQGAWIDIAYAAGNFTASAGTWTVDAGDQVGFAYIVRDRSLAVTFNLQTTSVSNAGVVLNATIPNGYVIGGVGILNPIIRASDAGAASVAAFCRIVPTATVLEMRSTTAGAAFAIAVNNTATIGTCEFPVT